jgi:hypothetical protein
MYLAKEGGRGHRTKWEKRRGEEEEEEEGRFLSNYC